MRVKGSRAAAQTPLCGETPETTRKPRNPGEFQEACFCAQAHAMDPICSKNDINISTKSRRTPNGIPQVQQEDQGQPTGHSRGSPRVPHLQEKMQKSKRSIQTELKWFHTGDCGLRLGEYGALALISISRPILDQKCKKKYKKTLKNIG